MAFNVTFYSLSKRENSTKRPTAGTGVSYPCIIKTNSGIMNPTIELNLGLASAPAYNYAYISEFGRYYFVDEWTFSERKWTASLRVDVLATYKTNIGAASLYVLRAAAENDGNVIDTYYPTKTGLSFDREILTNPWASAIGYGCFVLGVVSARPHYGSIDYIICDSQAMNSIVQYLIESTVTTANNFDWDDASQALQLSLIDPLQYIKSCVYLPVGIGNVPGTAASTVRVFKYQIPVQGTAKILQDIPRFTRSYSFTMPKHPQTNARGNYVNVAPFTTAELYFPPFGKIPIDTAVTANNTAISCNINVDVPTGRAIMEVKAGSVLLNKVETQLGVNVQLSQISRDWTSGLMSAGLSAAGASVSALGVGGALFGGGIGSAVNTVIPGIADAVTKKTAGIGDALGSLGVKVSNVGSGGSYAQLYEDPRLDVQFALLVDDDNTQNGRPLCKVRTLNTLAGYQLIQDGDIAITGTAQEASAIRAYLEGGYYYE